MQTTDHLIVSLLKKDINSPWLISTMDSEGLIFTYSIGLGGKSATGPKLKDILDEIDSKPKSYPYEYGMHLISNPLNRTVILNIVGEMISFTEITMQTKMFMMKDMKNKPLISPASKIKLNEDISITESQFRSARKMSLMKAKTSKEDNSPLPIETKSELVVGSVNRYWIFLNKSSVYILDGDTISGNIMGYGWPSEEQIPLEIKNINFKNGSNVKIRYNGMNSFETRKKDNSYSDKQNKISAKKYGVSLDYIYESAEEAKNLNQILMNTSSNVVAVSLQWDTLTREILVDTTGDRLMGTVFSTKYNSVKDASYAASNEKFTGLNINKEILKAQFSKNNIVKEKFPKSYPLPLAEYADAREYYNNSGISTAGWQEELGLKFPPDIYGEKNDDKFKDDDDLIDETGNQGDNKWEELEKEKIETKVDVSIDGFINNSTDYVTPYDDRLENQIIYDVQSTLKNDMPFDYTNKVRIGDVLLNVPPTHIKMIRMPLNERVPVMRASTSLQKQIGSARVQLELSLVFNSLDAINGYQETAYLDKKNKAMNYYMDGFRPLLAQFKKAPFLPIDNEYINEKLMIDNVALVNIVANTIDGYPDAIEVKLLLEKFDASSYLMTTDKLGDIMNYPLLRWYYQDMLRPPSRKEPWRKHLPTIDRLDNNFTFKIANEAELSERNSLIKEFRNMPTPREQKKEKTDSNTKEGKKYEDAKRAQKVLNQMEKYQELIRKTKNKKLYTFMYEYNNPEEKEAVKNGIYVYGEDEKRKGKANNPYVIKRGLLNEKNYSCFIPEFLYESSSPTTAFESLKSDFKKIKVSDMHVTDYVKKHNHIGIGQIAFLDENNESFFEKNQTSKKRSDGSYQNLIPLTPDNISKLRSIASFKKKIEDDVDAYKEKYNFLASRIDASEENVPMDTIYIKNMIPVGLSVSMENRFTSVQVQSNETPTLQYMGGQEPSIQLTFITDEEGVYEVEKLMKKTAKYVKNYRESIVSGFIDIENPLVNIFGINSVIPENITYDTVKGQPEGKLVTLTFAGFDKTQRRLEALYGFTGGNPSDDLKKRAVGNYKPEKDNFYITEKMKQQELYPDMQLPRVSELESFLKNSGIETKIVKWENRTGQVFVDPDFYFSSKNTYRQILKEIVDHPDGMEIQWKDATGVSATTNSKDKSLFNKVNLDQEENKTYLNDEKNAIEPNFVWKMDMFASLGDETSEEDKDSESNKSGAKILPPPKIENEEVAKYFTKDSKTGKAPYQEVPSFYDWGKWPYNEKKTFNDYQQWKKTFNNIKEEDIWHYLAKTVMNTFPNLIYASKEIEGLKKLEIQKKEIEKDYVKKKSNYIGKYSISSSEFVYAVFLEQLAGKDLENGREPEKEAKNSGEWMKSLRNGSNPTYPFQRVMGYMKAIITYESKWQPFSSGTPNANNINSDGQPTRVGVMGVDVTKLSNKLEAQQVTWGWKRNIDHAVANMYKYYKMAQNNKYKEIKARTIDWMVVAHAGIPLPEVLVNDSKGNAGEDYLENSISPTASAYYNSVNSIFYSLYKVYTEKRAGFLYTNPNGKLLDKPYIMYANSTASPIAGVNASQIAGEGLPDEKYIPEKAQKANEEIRKEDAKVRQKEVLDNLLVNTWDLDSQYRSMFTDMLQTDHRGRMVRAFPTFSFYMIDEGKYFNEFRVWDNFYGYNAIQSIDVYKSRKIIADTAIITMSNMYSGLTSKRKDMEYQDIVYPSFFSSVFWSQYVMNVPSEDILDSKKELYKTMMLQTGARVHLRMGYGSDTRLLPTVFNGTITEMNTDEVIQIVCQGDGLELSNMISGSPDDDNKGMWSTIEPSNYMGKLLTSKGAWMKDIINVASKGKFFDNPNGVVHFGSPFVSPKGTTNWMSDDYGEATQNIYSQNGTGSTSQWKTAKGDDIRRWEGLMNPNFLNPFNEDFLRIAAFSAENDEDNILINIYNRTIWDIISTYALCTSDYTASVVPFEFRSTIFFGKPNWPYEYKYDSEYKFDTVKKNWERSITNTHKKTFMQGHIYDSDNSIIHNNIKASEEGIYTNVIVTYDGMSAPIVQADNDIRLDKQKTTTVEAPLISKFGATENLLKVVGRNYYTSEAYAQKYGHSTVRDFMKDMYKGELIVTGDPSIKPHDAVFLSDTVIDMQGNHLVKTVHHSMSVDEGFYSIIEPDAWVTNFNDEFMSISDKFFGASKATTTNVIRAGMIAGANKGLSSPANKLLRNIAFEAKGLANTIGGSKVMTKANEKVIAYSMENMAEILSKDTFNLLAKELKTATSSTHKYKLMGEALSQIDISRKELKELKRIKNGKNISKSMNIKFFSQMNILDSAEEVFKLNRNAYHAKKAITTTKKGASLAKNAKNIIGKTDPISIVVSSVVTVATSGFAEMWFRKKQDSECVKIYPLKYKGQNFTAGINGHRGAVYGDLPSMNDRMMNAQFFGGDNEVDKNAVSYLFKLMNFFSPQNAPK